MVIQPFNYQKRTNIEEHNQIVDKINEVVDAVNNIDPSGQGLEPRVTALETDVTDLGVRVDSVESKNTQQDTAITNIDGRLTTLAGNYTTLGARVDSINTEVGQLSTGIGNLETGKVNVSQGRENGGKYLRVGPDGNVKPATFVESFTVTQTMTVGFPTTGIQPYGDYLYRGDTGGTFKYPEGNYLITVVFTADADKDIDWYATQNEGNGFTVVFDRMPTADVNVTIQGIEIR